MFIANVECAIGGQCSPIILGGPAGSGKTTLTKYFFRYKMHNIFQEGVKNSLLIFYTITDSKELMDISIFYTNLIKEILIEIEKKSDEEYQQLKSQFSLDEDFENKNSADMKRLFESINKYLSKKYRPLMYVIDEIDYIVDVINSGDDTFVKHLRHIISFFSEIRYAVLILASTKLPASYIKMKMTQSLGPAADRISETVELKYDEDDFLKFVETRFKEPIIVEQNGTYGEKILRLPSRDLLENDYGSYHPFTEDSLRFLFQFEKGIGIYIERLRPLERMLAKMINIYCSDSYAFSKSFESGKLFTKELVEKFITLEDVGGPVLPPIFLTPDEEQWFSDFFGFTTNEFTKFNHERIVNALTMSLYKYLGAKSNKPEIFTFDDEESLEENIITTKKGLKYYFEILELSKYNLSVVISLLREQELRTYGIDSILEMIEATYSKRLYSQKKIIMIMIEDDFEFAETAVNVITYIKEKEKSNYIHEDDVNNIEIDDQNLTIKSSNSFRLKFLKYTKIVEVLSILSKKRQNEVLNIGDDYLQSLNHAISEWDNMTYDFYNYNNSMERILQTIFMYVIKNNSLIVTEKKLRDLFDVIKKKGDSFKFIDLRMNGYLREFETGKFEIFIPPTIKYFLSNYSDVYAPSLEDDFGEVIGPELSEFLTKFIGLKKQNEYLKIQDLDVKTDILDFDSSVDEFAKYDDSDEHKDLEQLIQYVADADFDEIDKKLGLAIKENYSVAERVFLNLIRLHTADIKRKIRRMKKTSEKLQQVPVLKETKEGAGFQVLPEPVRLQPGSSAEKGGAGDKSTTDTHAGSSVSSGLTSIEEYEKIEAQLIAYFTEGRELGGLLEKIQEIDIDTIWDIIKNLFGQKKINVIIEPLSE